MELETLDTQTDALLEESSKTLDVDTSLEGTRADTHYHNNGGSYYCITFYEIGREKIIRNELGINPNLTKTINGIPFHEVEDKFRRKIVYKIELRAREDKGRYIKLSFERYHSMFVDETLEEIAKGLEL
jgi:hypothetical protein